MLKNLLGYELTRSNILKSTLGFTGELNIYLYSLIFSRFKIISFNSYLFLREKSRGFVDRKRELSGVFSGKPLSFSEIKAFIQ